MPGLVSKYELREAARFTLTSWDRWLELDEDERAERVAHFRVYHAVQANVSDAHSQYMDRQARRANRRGRRR